MVIQDGILRARDVSKISASKNRLVTVLIFIYWLLYENIFFFYSDELGILYLTNAIKLGLPFLLFFIVQPSWKVIFRSPVNIYLFFFTSFLIWALVPTTISGDPMEVFKLIPRFVFFVAVVGWYSKRPTAFNLFAKYIVIYVLLALLQWVLLYMTSAYNNVTPMMSGIRFAGPLGILGNVTSMMFFPGTGFPFIRLCGYWNEPSNASASAFAGYFLARYLFSVGEGLIWRMASYACLVAGFLALSNAGYLALSAALMFGVVYGVKKIGARELAYIMVVSLIVMSLITVASFGRKYVSENMPDNDLARAIVGAHDVKSTDYASGRFDLLDIAIDKVGNNIIGTGIQVVGPQNQADISPSAPIMWLLFTGVPGFLLLLGRETVLLICCKSISRRNPVALLLAQALIVVMIQHVSYGSWMNPNYFVYAAVVFAYSYALRQLRYSRDVN